MMSRTQLHRVVLQGSSNKVLSKSSRKERLRHRRTQQQLPHQRL